MNMQTEYVPEVINIYKDYIYEAISALKIGLENTEELIKSAPFECNKQNLVYLNQLKLEKEQIKAAIAHLTDRQSYKKDED